MNIILGSKSPRRRELFAGLDVPFTALNIECEESYPSSLTAGDIPMYIARSKARAYMPRLTANDILVTADTIVWFDGEMLGKPVNVSDAKEMLCRLSGKTHQVFTAVCITTLSSQKEFVCSTDVSFKSLTREEIDYYVEKYLPLDKAGAYGIQEWIGYVGVTSIQGSFYNVMGLPVQRLSEVLRTDFGVTFGLQ